MADIIKDVEHLAREIGPRPAGTEEERLAAMYIAENIQKRSGLSFDIEDFEGAKGKSRVFYYTAILSALLVIVASLLPILTIPALIITIVVAVIVVMESLGKPILSNFLRFGISQNVVAKYEPGYNADNQQTIRKRKVVLVTHYDSGHATNGTSDSTLKITAIANLIQLAAFCLIPLVLLIKVIAFSQASGATFLLFIIFSILLAVFVLAPLLLDFLESKRPYTEAANCNGSGSAALIEIARQLGTGSYNVREDVQNHQPVIHGKRSTEKVAPKDAKVEYKIDDPLIQHEQSLANAKAAVEAFTAPRAPRKQYDDDGNVIEQSEEKKENSAPVLIDDAAAERKNAEAQINSVPAYKTQENKGETPSWFTAAQSKAKKEDNFEPDDEKRSRFAHTMDVMAKREAEEKARIEAEEEAKRAKLRAQIEAAQKAAEEERKKVIGDQKPFVEDDKEEEEPKEEKLSLDERFKRRQQESKKVETPKVEEVPQETPKTPEVPETTQLPKIAEPVMPKAEPQPVVEDIPEVKEPEAEETAFMPPVDVEQIQQSKQYAPLSDENFVSSNELPENSSMIDLPEVFGETKDIEQDPEYAKALKDADVEAQQQQAQEVERGKFGTGSFAAVSESEGMAGATGTFAPVSEELIEDASKSGEVDVQDMVVEDADDSVYNEGQFTEAGAFAGSSYVDIPKKKKGVFGLFSKKDAGKHANKDEGFVPAKPFDENEIDWEGGAAGDAVTSGKQKISSMVDAVPEFSEQIQEFHNNSINLDVWMVALGSEIKENAGIKSFLMEHAQELKGAVIIDIEGIGAGELSLVNSEGYFNKSKTSPRIKRYIRQAANKLNLKVPSLDIPWSSSSAAYANKAGYKAIRLVGSDGKKPAYYMQNDDVVENIEVDTLTKNIEYIMELIQTI